MVESDPMVCLDVTLKDKMRKVSMCTREDRGPWKRGRGRCWAPPPGRA